MSNLIDNILDLKEKVIVDAGLHKLCDQNSKLTEKMSHTTSENKKTSNWSDHYAKSYQYLDDKTIYVEKN